MPATLPKEVRDAYERLDAELGLGAEGEGAPPGDDRARFDPEAVYQACLREELASFGGISLGGILAPLRVLTFWRMKRRAQRRRAGGVAALLAGLQGAAPAPDSTSWVTASAASSSPRPWPPPGPVGAPSGRLPGPGAGRDVAVVLLLGHPLVTGESGLLPPRPRRRARHGPVVVTTSMHDRAVGSFYPIGAGAGGQVDYLPDRLPTYGAIGAFGVRGPGIRVVDDDLRPVEDFYALQSGVVHNLRADEVIRDSAG